MYWFFGVFIFYLVLNILISGFYETIPLIVIYASTVNWLKLTLSFILTLAIGFLVALNTLVIYMKYKERKKCKGTGIAGVGAVGGLIVGVCPLCVTGIFPLLLGFAGIGFSFASLPFEGIEIQILVIVILLISLYILTKERFK